MRKMFITLEVVYVLLLVACGGMLIQQKDHLQDYDVSNFISMVISFLMLFIMLGFNTWSLYKDVQLEKEFNDDI